MKEFEKFLTEELDKDNGSLTSRDEHYRWRNRDSWARDAWKAALGWVLSRARIDENNYRYIEHNESENCIICDIYRELDKELFSEQSDD